ncbi:MAG: hypothetical protein SVV80_08435 [Planctomycetota bacterium]|nr:hypothetical protein [Planctomycetota bacterium]
MGRILKALNGKPFGWPLGAVFDDIKDMKKVFIGSILMLCLVGCSGRDGDSSTDSDKPEPLLTRDQARKILWDLPEVAKWSDEVRDASGGKVIPVCKVERTPSDFESAGEKPAWIFKFDQSHKDRTILWQRFQVDAVSGDVSVWDPFKGKYIPLTVWRKELAFKRGLSSHN